MLGIRLASLYAAAAFFPIDAVFVRAGVGHGWLSATNGFDAPSSSLAANGLALLAGVGYRCWVADRAALTLEAQGFAHRYGAAGMRADGVALLLRGDWYFRAARPGRAP